MNKKEIVSQGSCFSELAKQAWRSLKGKWLISIAVLFFVILIHIGIAFIPKIPNLINLLVSPLLIAGLMLFFLRVIRNVSPLNLQSIFEPFRQYLRYFWANLRMAIFIFLWSLLLVIPGIMASFKYSMTFYVMLDNPQYTVKEAMNESCAIMYGHKWQLFGYSLLISLISFVISACTLGIGLFWLLPWNFAFAAAFYESVRRPTEDSDSASSETMQEECEISATEE